MLRPRAENTENSFTTVANTYGRSPDAVALEALRGFREVELFRPNAGVAAGRAQPASTRVLQHGGAGGAAIGILGLCVPKPTGGRASSSGSTPRGLCRGSSV